MKLNDNDLFFNRYTQTISHGITPHDSGCESYASLGLCDFDPLDFVAVQGSDRHQPHVPLLSAKYHDQLFLRNVL